MPDPVNTVAILCGGRGTRLRERTESIPKALVEIGGRPILWHIVRIYATQGFRRGGLWTRHKGGLIEGVVAAARSPRGAAGARPGPPPGTPPPGGPPRGR